MKKRIEVTLADGDKLLFQPFQDTVEFTDAAMNDESVEQPLVDELDEAIEFGDDEDRPDVSGYTREAKEIYNHRRLGKN